MVVYFIFSSVFLLAAEAIRLHKTRSPHKMRKRIHPGVVVMVVVVEVVVVAI